MVQDHRTSSGLANTAYAAFLRYTEYFFQVNGHLWRRDPRGRHKVVIDCDKRPAILAAAHDAARHHGDFATRAHIIDRYISARRLRELEDSTAADPDDDSDELADEEDSPLDSPDGDED